MPDSKSILDSISEKLKKEPYWATVPIGMAGGAMLSRAIEDPENRSALNTAFGALAGAGAGTVAGKALAPPKDLGPYPPAKMGDVQGEWARTVVNPAATVAKSVMWDDRGPIGKSIITLAAAALITNRLHGPAKSAIDAVRPSMGYAYSKAAPAIQASVKAARAAASGLGSKFSKVPV